MVVSLVRGTGLRMRRLDWLMLQLFAGVVILPAHAGQENTLPAGGVITSGSASISQTNGALRVQQASARIVTNWDSFSIGSKASVEFVQPSKHAVALNRVVGASPSEILGRLSANGQVFLVNPNGIVFGNGARVDVGGIVASTLALSDTDFNAGRYRFTDGGRAGAVINQGSITAREGGYVALLGAQVRNEGVIAARVGQVALGAGERLAVDFNGDGLISLSVDQGMLGALVENSGLINADGGLVLMRADAASAMPGSVLNQSGMIQARSIQERNGRVYLDGGSSGDVLQSGTIDVSGRDAGETGGQISILGQRIGLLSGAHIDASGAAGGGTVLVGGNWQGGGSEAHAQSVLLAQDATIATDALNSGTGGRTVLWSTDYTGFFGSISARGIGSGGEVETSSLRNLQVSGSVDASAASGIAGKWLMDPADITITSTTGNGVFSGGNPDIFTPSAATASINVSTINASLNNGTDVTVQTSGATGGNGDITVASAISKTAGGDATLKLLADRDIIINGGTGISSTNGKLNVLLNARVNDGATGRIGVNSPITTNGGNLSLIGGSASGYAVGNGAKEGVSVNAALSAGGGGILIKGKGGTVGPQNAGIVVSSSIGTSGTGTITLDGVGGAGGAAWSSRGIYLFDNGAISSGSGAISLTGVASSTTGSRSGIELGGSGTRTISSSGGNISLFSTTATGDGTAIFVPSAASISTTGNGAVTISGTGGGAASGIRVNNILTVSSVSGPVAIAGAGAQGITIVTNTAAGVVSVTSTGGNVSFNGTGNTSQGINLSGAGASLGAVSTNGDISVTGTTANGIGINFAAPVTITAGGAVALSGTGAGSGSGVKIDGTSANAVITTTGTGAITVNGTAGASGGNGINLNPTSGTTHIYSTGGGNLVLDGTASTGNSAIYASTACLGYNCAAVGNTNNVTLTATQGAMNLGPIRAAGNFSATNNGTASTDTLTFNDDVTATGTLTGRSIEGNLTVASGKTLTSNSATTDAMQLGAGTQHISTDATGGNVILNGSLATPSSRAVVWTGAIGGTASGTNFNALAPSSSSRFRYGRAWADTALLGNAPTTGVLVQYREQPALTLTLANTGAIYNGITLSNTSFSQTTGNYSAAGFVNGDTLADTGLAGSLAFNGGIGTAVRNTGTYAVTQGSLSSLVGYSVVLTTPANYLVSPAGLTVTANSAAKTYDANIASSTVPTITSGSLLGSDSATLSQSFDSRHAGTGKILTPSIVINDGNNGNNYTVSTVNDFNGVITPAALTITAVADTKTYDAGTASSVASTITSGSLLGSDSATLSQSFDNRHAGAGKILTPSIVINDGNNGNNYTVSTVNDFNGVITPAALTITAVADTKTYDAGTASSVASTITSGSLLGSDSATLSQSFDNRHAGVGKILTPSIVINDGNNGNNYTVSTVNDFNGVITPAALTITAVADTKTYDAGTASGVASTITSGSLLGSDSATLSQSFDSRHAGTGKILTPSIVINDGNNGNNYTVSTVNDFNGVINPAALSVIPTATNRSYDGVILNNAAYSQSLNSYSVSGFVGDEDATQAGIALSGSMAFNGNTATAVRNVGSYTLGLGTLVMYAANDNYTMNFGNTTPTNYVITPRGITVTARTDTKTYDANIASSVSPIITSGSLVAGDSAVLSQTFDTKNVGTGKTLTPAVTVNDGNGGNNYAITTVNDSTGVIKPRSITIASPTISKLFGEADPVMVSLDRRSAECQSQSEHRCDPGALTGALQDIRTGLSVVSPRAFTDGVERGTRLVDDNVEAK
jgi:filamentous hemagglutinin family protein